MKIIGKNVDLVEVKVADAEFILSLRQNPDLNKYLSFVDNDLKKQKQWLQKSIFNKNEYYYLIKNKKNTPVGTIRIYDIRNNVFCWGSWIILPEHRKYSSLESMFLLLKFAFFDLNLLETNFDVRKDNQKVINFHLKSGAVIIDEDSQNFFFNYKKEYFLDKYDYYREIVEKTKSNIN